MNYTVEIPNELIAAILEHRCVLFAGAGLSRGAIQDNGGSKEVCLPTSV